MKIRDHRETEGLTRAQVARRLGVSPTAVRKWEVGLAHPSADKLPALAGLLGCTIDELFGQGGPSQAAGQPGGA